jgi:hypothetical protein
MSVQMAPNLDNDMPATSANSATKLETAHLTTPDEESLVPIRASSGAEF